MILSVYPDPLGRVWVRITVHAGLWVRMMSCLLGKLIISHHDRVESFFTTGNCLNRKLMANNVLFACGNVHQGDRHFSAES